MAPVKKNEAVLVIGASDKPERYSYKAIELLKTYGHKPYGISPSVSSVLGVPCFKTILDFKTQFGQVDTITMYVNPALSTEMVKEMIALHPKRVIFNPGSENPKIYEELNSKGIETEEACTLVLLRTRQY